MKRFMFTRSATGDSLQVISRDTVYSLAAGIWLTLIAIGLGFLMRYANAPGDRGNPLIAWPVDSVVTRSKTRPTLLVFAHPKCPCTRATIDELAWVLARCETDVDCQVLFFHADGEDSDWAKTACWRKAAAIEGTTVLSDPQSRIASTFGVRTSGHVLLYSPSGELLFEGGITRARGHRGESMGRAKLLSVIRGDPNETPRQSDSDTQADSTCVFGCPLHSPEVAARLLPDSVEG